ncbi:MAG: dynamin family protein [Propionivibrio sp.]
MTFGDNHRRHLLATLRHVDEILGDACARLSAGASGQLFPVYVADAAPTQCRIAEDYLARFRDVARRFLDAQAIRDEKPRIGALWALRTAINFAQTGLDEITPDRLAGYGPVSPDDGADVERLIAELQAILAQLDDYLARGLGGDIAARLARLDETRDEVALLREIERVVAAHGLVEFRTTLGWLVERLEHDWLEVAFIGRVSSGKSSLLNALLEHPVLPVGVTPVTAVPTRIVPGAPAITVSFATGNPLRAGLERLAEFASEEGNPGNARHVTDILVELASPRLEAGVCFVDTPGLGSLAAAGAAQTLAYLPRCDVGVLLIDGTGTLSAEDVAVARKLLEAGADLVPALGKADLLAPADRQRLQEYAGRELETALGTRVEVSAVSAIADGGREATAWFDRCLAPRLQRHRELRAVSLRRKIGALREAVVAALRRHAGSTEAPATDTAAVADGLRALEQARQQVRDLAAAWRNPGALAPALEDAAHALAEAWTAGSGTAEKVGLALARHAEAVGGSFEDILAATRSSLEDAAPTAFHPAGFLPHAAGRPLFDPASLVTHASWTPGLLRLPGKHGLHAEARRRVEANLAAPFADAFSIHLDALKRWSLAALARLEQGYGAMSAAAVTPAARPDGTSPRLSEDLARLEGWNAA